MEPLLISSDAPERDELADLALELTALSTSLRSSLPEGVVEALSTLVRAMNCYYSNLIEGHDTHPIDIERALNGDYSSDASKRDLQLEAKAHIEVQAWIDAGGLPGSPTAQASLLEMHARFCSLLPPDLLKIANPETGEILPLAPGQLRRRDVAVGRHVPVSPGALPRFMVRFEKAFAKLGRVDAVLSAATAHHRLLWMHPFLDGNGRVARLMSYAMLRQALDTGGIWSIARGLARNEAAYKKHLSACDQPRHGDLDGRGNLSQAALAGFTKFFLETSIDQVRFMENLVQPDRLRDRILIWTEEEIRAETLPPRSGLVLEAVLYRGTLPRSDVPALIGATDRTARRLTSALLEHGVLTSAGPRAPLRLAFPARLAARWMPGLFPDQ
ncbi:MAG: Fic family protein [Pseudomonadota bacterium]